jgi:hypothetical protein
MWRAGTAPGQRAGDDAERAASLVAGDHVALIGQADDGVGQHTEPVSRKPPLQAGSQTS